MRLNPFRSIFVVIVLFSSISGSAFGQISTNCDECWLTVRHWRGTYTTSATGSGQMSGCSGQINSSSQGSFEIIDGVVTLTGNGSISETYTCSCSPDAEVHMLSVA